MTLLTNKYFLLLCVLSALCVVLWFWRSEIYRAAESACIATVTQSTVNKNEQSRKDANEVKKDEQTRDKCAIISGLNDLGILRENRGCQ